MKIDLTELLRDIGNESDVKSELKLKLDEEGLKLTKPVQINLHLVNAGSRVIMEGAAETEAELSCSRCLKAFKYPLKLELKEAFAKVLPDLPSVKGGFELREEDFVSPIDKNNCIDISDIISQSLFLALPIKALCEEKCQGLKG